MKLRVGATLFALAAAFFYPANAMQAEDALFKIHAKGSASMFAVTTAEIAGVGEHEYMAVLPGGEGKPQAVKGPLVRDLLKAAGLHGTKIWVKALDGYEMDIPYTDVASYDVMLATMVDGQALSVRDRGPAWIVYPTVDHPELQNALYEARSVWQIKELIVE